MGGGVAEKFMCRRCLQPEPPRRAAGPETAARSRSKPSGLGTRKRKAAERRYTAGWHTTLVLRSNAATSSIIVESAVEPPNFTDDH
jgi:hypothetical protein